MSALTIGGASSSTLTNFDRMDRKAHDRVGARWPRNLWLPKITSGLARMQRWATLIAGMIDLLKLLGGLLVGAFRSHAAREAEMAFLRQQLVILKRSAPARLRLRAADRLIFVWLYRRFPSVLEAAVVFKPETPPCCTDQLGLSVLGRVA